MIDSELAGTTWKTSTRCGGSDNCVEVAVLPDAVGVRDTKDRDGGTLAFTSIAWRDFLSALASDRYQA